MIRKFSRKNGFLFPYNCFSIWWDRIERHGTVSFRVGEDTYLCIIYLSNSRIQMIPRAEEGCNLRLIKRCLEGRKGGAGIADRFPFLSRLSTTPLCEGETREINSWKENDLSPLSFSLPNLRNQHLLFHFAFLHECQSLLFTIPRNESEKRSSTFDIIRQYPFKHLFLKSKSHLRVIKLPLCWRDRS